MTTAKTTTKLEEKLNDQFDAALKAFKAMVIKHKEGKEIIKQLPDGLADMRWYAFSKLDTNKWYLETWGMEAKEADEFIESLRIMGVYALASKHLSFNNAWQYTGYLIIGDVEITIKIDGGSKPPNCRIEEIREMKEVVTYKSICDEMEEE